MLRALPEGERRQPRMRLEQAPSNGPWKSWQFFQRWHSPSGLADLEPVVVVTTWDRQIDYSQINHPIESLKWVGRLFEPTIDVERFDIGLEDLQALIDCLGSLSIPLSHWTHPPIYLGGCRRSFELGWRELRMEWQQDSHGLDLLDQWFDSALEKIPG